MREFKCYACKHTWGLPFGQGGQGVDQICPQCGSKNVHRVSKPGEFRWGRGRRFVDADSPSEPGWLGRGPGRGFGRGQRFVDDDSTPGMRRRWWGRGRRGRV